MINVSVSRLVNQVDKSQFTLYAEWEDTFFKIILLRSSTVPLKGEMHLENANYFLQHLEEPLETYLEKTRQAFSGKNADMQFFLQDDTFTWKQRNILTRGEITVHPLSNVLIVSDTLKHLLELYQTCQERIVVLEQENECLNKINNKLVTDVERMIDTKNRMEEDLYEKFLVLLNTKKKRIRELQEIIDRSERTSKTVYDETTDDESEGASNDSKTMSTKSPRKRKINCKNEQRTVSKSSRIFDRFTSSSSSNNASPEPSTSKRTLDSKHHMPRQLSNTPEEESEEDIFLQ